MRDKSLASNSTSIWPFVPTNSKLFDTFQVVKAEGNYIYTSSGDKILDASAGAAVGNIGWGRRDVAEAAAKALTDVTYALPPFATPERLALIRTLQDHWLPGHIRKVSFFGSGSEANDAAIRLARQYQLARGRQGRFKVIGRDISYNGTSLTTLDVGGHSSRKKDFAPLMLGMPHAPACYCFRCPLGKTHPSCKVACARELEAIIEREGADTIAAFMAEPIVGTSGGALVPPDDYWPVIQSICKRHDILLIADEVLTGFGRTGARFAVDHWDVQADVLVLGKGMSGGYASVSAVAATENITGAMEEAGIMPMFHTYGGHPAHCAAANKVLQIIDEEGLIDRVKALGPIFEQKMRSLESHDHVANVRGRGFFWSVEIVRDRASLERFAESDAITFKLMEATCRRGVFTYFGGTGEVRDIINVAPHFIIDESHMDDIVAALDEGITEVCRSI
jgi:adenosylmethionine-8-amino-7-oxononanoate aminotransferase